MTRPHKLYLNLMPCCTMKVNNLFCYDVTLKEVSIRIEGSLLSLRKKREIVLLFEGIVVGCVSLGVI